MTIPETVQQCKLDAKKVSAMFPKINGLDFRFDNIPVDELVSNAKALNIAISHSPKNRKLTYTAHSVLSTGMFVWMYFSSVELSHLDAIEILYPSQNV